MPVQISALSHRHSGKSCDCPNGKRHMLYHITTEFNAIVSCLFHQAQSLFRLCLCTDHGAQLKLLYCFYCHILFLQKSINLFLPILFYLPLYIVSTRFCISYQKIRHLFFTFFLICVKIIMISCCTYVHSF